MKVSDLKDELIARNLSTKGLKAQLIARLTKRLKTETDTDRAHHTAISANATSKEIKPTTKKDQSSLESEKLLTESDDIMMDTDLNDMMVIDEYDSTKTTNKDSKDKKTESTPRVIDERERYYLEKHYSLPAAPHIVVHPSRSAKSGKFDCTIMSLSLLLDYRRDDTKEHSFEVSLFAELFNEMLMRDFGFNIYKALYAMPDKVKETSGDAKKNGDDDTNSGTNNGGGGGGGAKSKESKKGDDNDAVEAPPSKDDDDSTPSTTTKKSDRRDRDEKEGRDRKTRRGQSPYRADECSDDESTKSVERRDRKRSEREPATEKREVIEKREKDRNKYVTANPELLLSFVYFDQTHCGYIFEKDIEDLFYTLGLNLSRAQTRKLVGKVITRDSLYYRKLTDQPRVEEVVPVSESVVSDKTDDSDAALSVEIAKGNKMYLPVFKSKENDTTSTPSLAREIDVQETDETTMETDGDAEQKQQPDKKDVLETTSGMVIFKGGLIDLEKLIDQMKRSERAREDTEQLLVEVRKQNTEMSGNLTKSQAKIKDLSFDLKNSYRILAEAESSLSSSQKKINEYASIITSVYDKVAPIVLKTEKNSRHDS